MNFIVDLDGTLINSIPVHIDSFIRVFKRKGLDDEERLRKKLKELMGRPVKDIIKELFSSLSEEEIEEIWKEKWEDTLKHFDEIEEMKGATEVLNELKKRGKVALVTSSSREFVELVLKKFGWKFDLVVTSDDVEEGKPDTEPYEKVIEEFGRDILVIGDTENDEVPAKKLGLKFLRFGRDVREWREVLDFIKVKK
ncbi:hypothetical protein DRN62_02285 [Nanoarchaeota archaeon]|nr:MAG: hypothetical protein DRN62_02285 [Nanoarchaeota archaeon]